MSNKVTDVWIFNGPKGRFASGVFTEKNLAEIWIVKNQLTGTLTSYPVDLGVYQWALENGYFVAIKEHEKEPEFIANFSSASQDHFHYVAGRLE